MTVIAGRLCIDTHRRRGRSEPSDSVDLGVIDGGQEQVVDAVDLEILRSAMVQLAPRHREVLDLREQQGWSYQQIADHYGVTLGTVEALLFRARKALKREFMAAVGGDRNWAAVPVFGIVLGRLGSWKARLDAWAAAAVPSIGGAAMAAVIAVTAVTGAVGAGVLRGSDGDARPSTSVTMAPSAATTTSLTELLDAPGPAIAAAEVRDDDAGRGVRGGDDPAITGAIGANTIATDEMPYAEGEQVNQQQPVQVNGPGIFASLDPVGATTEAVESIENYLGVQP
jgi:hypothetical protein